MEDFDKYLKEDADEQERAAAEQVRKGLAGLELEHKIAEAAQARQQWLRRRIWRNMVLGAGLLVVAGAAYLFFVRRNVAPPSSPDVPGIQQVQTPPDAPQVAQQVPDETNPVAQRPANPREQTGASNLRAVQSSLDSATNRLIDVLLKTTQDNAPSKKGATNESTELWSDAVKFLRQNKPLEAKALLFKLEARGDDQNARWLLGIALLEEGKPEEALAIFEKISRDSQHPRRKDAQLAVEALQ